jgi:alpha-beta hydrolase superfamily lysophospholipase
MRAADGVQLKGRVWQGKPGLPVVIYLHGIEGHSAWFENTAAVLSQRGITVYAPDRRGSGLNPRDRGHLNDYKEFLSDVEATMRRVSSLYVGHPIVLMANCWSARAAAIIARQDYKPVTGSIGTPLSGLVLTCPAIFTKADFDSTTKLKIFYEWIQGSYRLLRYWPIPLTTEMFTNNPPYLDYVENDTLRLKEATTSFYAQTFIMNWRAKRAAPFIDLPTIVLQAGSDRIVDIEKLEAWYAKIKTSQKTMRIFPDAVHSLDFDQTWFRDYTHLLTEWLLARSPVSV